MDRGRTGPAAWVAAAVCALIIAALAAAAAGRTPAPPSSTSAAPGGMKGLYLLLQGEGVAVSRVDGPSLPRGGVLVAAAGPAPVAGAAARKLLQWAAAGNELVVLGPVEALGAPLHVRQETWPFGGADARAAVALPALRGADTLHLPQGIVLLPGAGGVPLYTVLGQPAALTLPWGLGRVYWLGSATAWSNATLARYPGNLALAESLLHGSRPVAFDEYWFGSGLAASQAPHGGAAAKGAPLPLPREAGVAAAAAAAAAATALWAAGWRRHPVRRDPPAAPTAAEPAAAYAEMLLQTDRKGNAGA